MGVDEYPIRVVVAGPDLEGRARELRDEGLEVIYLGAGLTAEQIVETALQEDVSRIVTSTDLAAVLLAYGIDDIAVEL